MRDSPDTAALRARSLEDAPEARAVLTALNLEPAADA
jgi:hypothetical protein